MSRRLARERGAALVVTMMLMVALLAAGGLALYLQMADTHAARYVAESRAAMFCAEAGLAGGRDYIAANNARWNDMLDATSGNDPAGYPVEGDLDGDGAFDWRVTIRDDDDEYPNDPQADSNGSIFLVSDCIQYADTPRQVMQLISYSGGGFNYRDQSGQGAGGTNNAN